VHYHIATQLMMYLKPFLYNRWDCFY